MFIAWIHEGLQNGDILITSLILPLLVGILLESETSPHWLFSYPEGEIIYKREDKYLMLPFYFLVA